MNALRMFGKGRHVSGRFVMHYYYVYYMLFCTLIIELDVYAFCCKKSIFQSIYPFYHSYDLCLERLLGGTV